MSKILLGSIIGAVIGIISVYAGFIWSNCPIKIQENKQQENKQIESRYLINPKERCYFTSTFGDITKEEELNCDYYDKYYSGEFNTIHVDSLPHGIIK